jgi:hypothetical protein
MATVNQDKEDDSDDPDYSDKFCSIVLKANQQISIFQLCVGDHTTTLTMIKKLNIHLSKMSDSLHILNMSKHALCKMVTDNHDEEDDSAEHSDNSDDPEDSSAAADEDLAPTEWRFAQAQKGPAQGQPCVGTSVERASVPCEPASTLVYSCVEGLARPAPPEQQRLLP